jgi:hypothetical protein
LKKKSFFLVEIKIKSKYIKIIHGMHNQFSLLKAMS